MKSALNEKGYLIMSIYDFLLKPDSLEMLRDSISFYADCYFNYLHQRILVNYIVAKFQS